MDNKKFEDPFLKILPSLDVHGETRDTVWTPVDSFIKENIYLNRKKIYIIHGRNGHILKNEIHTRLKKDKRIEKYYIYGFNDGITIIELK